MDVDYLIQLNGTIELQSVKGACPDCKKLVLLVEAETHRNWDFHRVYSLNSRA